MKLADRFALVTGGSRGIGRATALALAEAGADVALSYEKNAALAEEVAEALRRTGRQALAVQAEVSDAASVRRMVSTVVEAFGRIDILVNNAGVGRATPFLEISEAEWDWILDVDLKGPFLVGQEVARLMVARGYGRILNLSSTMAVTAYPGMVAYQAAKAGVAMLTRGMALELGPHGITVNAIAPGTILTDMNRERWADPERRAKRVADTPVGRLGAPADLVGTIVHLVSDEASHITGAVVIIDGGFTLA